MIGSEEITTLIEDIAQVYGYDFSNYNQGSLLRRINRLYVLDGFKSFMEFRYKVLLHKDYFIRFIEEITINVTEMFRDSVFFKYLRISILPCLSKCEFIRVWVAGCSTGEEALSVAILLKELNLLHKSLIYATDICVKSLEKASQGKCSLNTIRSYSENYLASGGVEDFSKYYKEDYDTVQFDKSLLKNIVFSTHNLVSDSSFNEFQLILCRNVLIYFDKTLQNRVLNLFNQSLADLGYLGLGSKESLRFSEMESKFELISDCKIWRKIIV